MPENTLSESKAAATESSAWGLPGWARIAVALVGAIGALGTLFTGVYQVEKEQHEFQLAQQSQAKSADKEIAQLELSIRADEQKRAEADLERQRQEAITAAANQHAAELQLQLKEADLSETERQSVAARQRDEDKRVREVIQSLLTPDGKSGSSSLAFLANDTNPKSSYRKIILAALVAKSENLSTPIEAGLLVSRMAEIGPEALDSLIDLNRSALQSAITGLEQESAAARPETPQSAFQHCVRAHPLLDPWFTQQVCPVIKLAGTEQGAASEKRGNTVEVSAALAEASGLALPRLVQLTGEPVSLRKCWLAKSAWKGKLPRIDFEYAFVYGIDLSTAMLDDESSSSLLRSYVTTNTQLGTVLTGSKPAYVQSFLTQACRLGFSEQQIARLISLSNSDHDLHLDTP